MYFLFSSVWFALKDPGSVLECDSNKHNAVMATNLKQIPDKLGYQIMKCSSYIFMQV